MREEVTYVRNGVNSCVVWFVVLVIIKGSKIKEKCTVAVEELRQKGIGIGLYGVGKRWSLIIKGIEHMTIKNKKILEEGQVRQLEHFIPRGKA